MIKKILVANRGEIAIRILRACRELNISSVAIYSEADRTSLHVQIADEARCIGPPSPLESYLNMDNIIETAKEAGADAIHPGYGFLAENHLFAERCEQEGFIFIGPNSGTLKLVGDKLAARRTLISQNVPVIPGMEVKTRDFKEMVPIAADIGYPVIVKASLGGGGKGMRIVEKEEDLEKSLKACSREAQSAFGDETVYIEKYIESPRHVEFQVLVDGDGNAIHLFERECSIQRRHQKVVEESPSLALTPELRQKMGDTAVNVAKAVGYSNAGTVEFLLDADKNFYFLEVNARLQVEHPVTEFVTGVDLVHQQIAIASGEKLSLQQSDVEQRGHSIECRVYAEDPDNNFLPSSGEILFVKEPRAPGVRCDSSLYSGCEVPVYYDPILSKVIVWAQDRDTARQRMIRALESYVILGIKTTVNFLKSVMEHPDFSSGETNTSFIEKNLPNLTDADEVGKDMEIALMAAAIKASGDRTMPGTRGEVQPEVPDPWLLLGDFELGKSK